VVSEDFRLIGRIARNRLHLGFLARAFAWKGSIEAVADSKELHRKAMQGIQHSLNAFSGLNMCACELYFTCWEITESRMFLCKLFFILMLIPQLIKTLLSSISVHPDLRACSALCVGASDLKRKCVYCLGKEKI